MSFLAAIVVFIGAFVGATIISLVLLKEMLSLIITVIGERHFAEAGGLDNGTVGLACGLVFATTLVGAKFDFSRALVAIPVTNGLAVLYALIWLRLAGREGRKRQFRLREGWIVRIADGARLQPTCIVQSSTCVETDAFSKYEIYYLTLYKLTENLVRNAYSSQNEQQKELWRVLRSAEEPPCRAMDLIFVWQETPLCWHEVTFCHEWTTLLCGPLDRHSQESRQWWRQLLLPTFPEDGLFEIAVAELTAIIEQFERHYSREIAQNTGRRNDWENLKTVCNRASGTIRVMTTKRYNKTIQEVAPRGSRRVHGKKPLVMTIE